MIDRDFLAIFLDEASEILSNWENICLTMENVPSEDSINALFRAAHNLKGSSRSVGLEKFGEFVHKIEDTITLVKQNPELASPPVLAIFLDCQAILATWIEKIRENPDYEANTDLITERLKTVRGAIEVEGSSEEESDGLHLFSDETINETPDETTVEETTVEETSSDQTPPTVDVPVNVTPKNLGEILIEKGHVTQEQIEDAVNVQNAKLGSILVAQGVTSKEAVKEAIEIQMAQGVKIDETIRVSLRKLDSLLRLVGELSIQHSIVSNANKHGTLNSTKSQEAISLTTKVIQDLQSEAMSLRMQPVESLLRRLDRVARDVARSQSKQIRVILSGESVEMDKTVLEKMKDPLVHIMRNAVDHGIESGEDRRLANKSAIATIRVEAVQTAANVCITISDDGRGLNHEKIKAKAISKGLITANQLLSQEEIHNLIFLPGFSTADQVTDVSGRGVGMDVVSSAVKSLNGSVVIDSEFGNGTTFSINLPSTLSVLDAIIVNVDDTSYALPIADIQEVVDMTSVRIESSGSSSRMMNIRGKVLPVESLGSFLSRGEHKKQRPTPTVAIVTSNGKSEIALLVDQIVGQQSIVVRPVDQGLDEIPGFSGATILSNGDPAMIVQLSQIIKSQQRKAG